MVMQGVQIWEQWLCEQKHMYHCLSDLLCFHSPKLNFEREAEVFKCFGGATLDLNRLRLILKNLLALSTVSQTSGRGGDWASHIHSI